MAFYFITGNQGKLREVQAILPAVEQLDIDLPEIQEIDAHAIIRAKLTEALKHTTGPVMVEDTSLYVHCLHGLPGPLIKWFEKTVGLDGLVDLAEKMGDSTATAKTIIGYATSPDDVHFFEGEVKGQIVRPRGTGFGWDAIFLPEGWTQTFGEVSVEQKQSISMRRQACEQLKLFLSKP